MASVISMKQLLEAGVHFGHQTRRWNPKMAEYIFTERNGIYIIDLQKTVKKVEEAYYFVREAAMNGEEVIFVGTKKQAQEAIKEEAERCGQYYVNSRWLGGMLTNFKTIKTRIDRLKRLEEQEKNGTFDVLPKKEVIKLKKEMDKLQRDLGGIKDMKKAPTVMFIVDPRKEHNAILEAKRLGMTVVAIVDTNCDPDEVDYVIPGNDDAIRAVKLIAGKMADAIIESRQGEDFVAPVAEAVEEPVVTYGNAYVSDAPVVEEVVAPVVEEVAAPVVEEVVAPVVEEVAAPVIEEVAAPVVEEAAPVVEEAPKAKKTTKKAKVETEEVVAEEVAAEEPVAE